MTRLGTSQGRLFLLDTDLDSSTAHLTLKASPFANANKKSNCKGVLLLCRHVYLSACNMPAILKCLFLELFCTYQQKTQTKQALLLQTNKRLQAAQCASPASLRSQSSFHLLLNQSAGPAH